MLEEYKVKQIWPAHADHISQYKDKWLLDMFRNSRVVAQRKYDGERMLIHFNEQEVYCTSRRISKKTNRYQENQDKLVNLPTLLMHAETAEKYYLGYTVLDCECYSNDWSSIVGILHSLPERAHELQKTTEVKFAVFDCIWLDGHYVGDLPYSERLEYAKALISHLDERFHIAETQYVNNLEETYVLAQKYWNNDLEGIVIKPLNAKYYDKGAMLKLKKTETVDVVVYGYQPGTGKYSNVVGALYVGYYNEETNEIVHISKVNCGTDEDRLWWKDYFNRLELHTDDTDKWKVLEVKCQEITDKSLRHPVYVRIRDDKHYKECTKDTIFK